MSISNGFGQILNDNPIAKREYTSALRQRGKRFWQLMFCLTGLLLAAPFIAGFVTPIYPKLSFILVVLFLLNIIAYPLVVLKALTLTSSSVSKERNRKTWELFQLTGVSTRRVVFGKLAAALRYSLRDFVWLYILRAGTALLFLATNNLEDDFGWRSDYPFSLHSYDNPLTLFDVRLEHEWLVGILLVMLGFTALEWIFSNTLGVATAFQKRWNVTLAMGIRFGLAIILPLAVFFIWDSGRYDLVFGDDVSLIVMIASTVFADNGALVNGNMFAAYTHPDDNALFLVAQFWGALLYMMGIAFALTIALLSAGRAGLAERDTFVKTKRKRPAQDDMPVAVQSIFNQRLLEPAHGSSNVFALTQPDDYRVDVYHYQQRIGRLYLRFSSARETFFVQLSNVTFIEAPAKWQGANFTTASEADYATFIDERGIAINSLRADAMRLYVLDGRTTVRIIASTAHILDELPSHI